MKPWKRSQGTLPDTALSILQWGHGDEAVEEEDNIPLIRSLINLQWGHGDEAVEE